MKHCFVPLASSANLLRGPSRMPMISDYSRERADLPVTLVYDKRLFIQGRELTDLCLW